MMNHQLPETFRNTIDELIRCREKSARQKYLLDLTESLLQHLCGFVLGEYKAANKMNLSLEKTLLYNSKNLAFGTYINFLRLTEKTLKEIGHESRLSQEIQGKNVWVEVKIFEKVFESVKNKIETKHNGSLAQAALEASKQNAGKTNLLEFFGEVVKLRNRVAHPKQEIKGVEIDWPYNEDYFDAINPYLESALFSVIDCLQKTWRYQFFRVADIIGNQLMLDAEDSETIQSVEAETLFEPGTRVLFSDERHLLLSDWRKLLLVSEQAMHLIQKEEEEKRKIGSINELKEQIKLALDDEQISLDEFRFFESIGKVKLDLDESGLKKLIMEVAAELGIENPFPDVDKRFIEVIDEALKSQSFNAFVLKLTGEQYGVDSVKFEEVVNERIAFLGLDAKSARKSKQVSLSFQELSKLGGLLNARMWIMGIHKLNSVSGESNYKIGSNWSEDPISKENLHRNAFKQVHEYVQFKLEQLKIDGGLEWDSHVNNWQIGYMTSYIWVCFYPKKVVSKSVIALHVSVYQDGSIAIGLLPDWKDIKAVSKFGLLRAVTRRVLSRFFEKYQQEISEHTMLKLWNYNGSELGPLHEVIQKYPWIIKEEYGLEQIQFVLESDTITENPYELTNAFEVSFNLFNKAIPDIISEYEVLNANHIQKSELEWSAAKHLLACSVEELNIIRNESAKLKNPGTLDLNEERGFVNYYLEAQEDGGNIKLRMVVEEDFYTNNWRVEFSFKSEGDTNSWHAKMNAVIQAIAVSGEVSVWKREGVVIVRMVNQELQHLSSLWLPFIQNLFSEFSLSLNKLNCFPLGITFPIQDKETHAGAMETVLNELEMTSGGMFSNRVQKQRNTCFNLQFVDIVSQQYKGKRQQLQWGYAYNPKGDISRIIQLDFIKSSEIASHLRKMEELASTGSWELLLETEVEDQESAYSNGENVVYSASSEFNAKHGAAWALLGATSGVANWSAKRNTEGQWIQIDFGQVSQIDEVTIMGRYNMAQWITKFKLLVSLDGRNWSQVGDVLEGNIGMNSPRIIQLEEEVLGRYIRMVPIEWHKHISARFDAKWKPYRVSHAVFKRSEIIETVSNNDLIFFQENISSLKSSFSGLFGLAK
jgi:hypothetical protein